MSVSDYLIQRRAPWSVSRVYGCPGDDINGIMGALERAQDRRRFMARNQEDNKGRRKPALCFTTN